ncbi:MAG: prenyltransferase/squalene oxidase repeat-containing protein [Minisyncoccia bacterium]
MRKVFILVLILLVGMGRITKAEEPSPTPPPVEPTTISLKIRSGETIFFDNLVELLPTGPTEINGHILDAKSVLATLNRADLSDVNWDISDLQYFESFGSFLLNCITSSVGTDSPKNDCYDWQYAVNGMTPGEGMDKKILVGGENVYVYFSPQNKITLSANTINTNDSLLATAEKYNFEDNTWLPAINITLGVTQPDPVSSFNPPIEIMTSPTDTIGQVAFTSISAGLYDVGIRDNFGYYFPTKPLTVTTPPPPDEGGGSSGGSSTPEPKFSAEDALSYLKNVQDTNGSFGDSNLYTDWAAIAYGAGGVSGSPRSLLLEYFNSDNEISSLITDNERRALALLALGENPYSFNDVNYIEAIVEEFDETQFGDDSLVNDDIFALIPLSKAGYDEDDSIITKTIDFIISKQEGDGSWEGSVDITAAAIQALLPFQSIAGVSGALTNAETYLINTQEEDGGWGNVSSTSWAMQAENILNASWTKNGKSGLDYLAEIQTSANNNGAMLPSSESSQNIIWTTSYAIPAGLGKPWSDIMERVSRPKKEDTEDNSSRSSRNDEDSEEEKTEEIVLPSEETNLVAPIAPISPEKITNIQEIEKLPDDPKKEIPPGEEKSDEPTTDIFTATAINAVPPQTSAPIQDIPIIIGTVSGTILLFALLKLLAIF